MYNHATAKNDEERVELSEVRVTLYRSKPQRVRLKQLAENRLREGLSLADEMHSIFAAIDELPAPAREEALSSVRGMARLLHIPVVDAFIWAKVANPRWPGLKSVIADDKISTRWQLRKVMELPDEVVAKVLPKIAQYGFSDDLLAEIKQQAPSAPKKAGRPAAIGVRVQARFTPGAGKRLVELLAEPLGLKELGKVDWSKPKEAAKAFALIAEKLNG